MIILRTKEKLSYFFKERFVLASFYAKRMCVQRWQIAAISGEGKQTVLRWAMPFPSSLLRRSCYYYYLTTNEERQKIPQSFPYKTLREFFFFEAMERAQTKIVWHAQPFRTEKILFSSNVMGVGKREHLPFLVFPFLFLFFRQIVLLRVHGWLQSCGAIFRWLKEKEEEEVLSPLSFFPRSFSLTNCQKCCVCLTGGQPWLMVWEKGDSFCGFFWVGRSVRLAATRQQQLSFYLLFLFHLGVIQSRLSV